MKAVYILAKGSQASYFKTKQPLQDNALAFFRPRCFPSSSSALLFLSSSSVRAIKERCSRGGSRKAANCLEHEWLHGNVYGGWLGDRARVFLVTVTAGVAMHGTLYVGGQPTGEDKGVVERPYE